jgi:hypothetical protein
MLTKKRRNIIVLNILIHNFQLYIFTDRTVFSWEIMEVILFYSDIIIFYSYTYKLLTVQTGVDLTEVPDVYLTEELQVSIIFNVLNDKIEPWLN